MIFRHKRKINNFDPYTYAACTCDWFCDPGSQLWTQW